MNVPLLNREEMLVYQAALLAISTVVARVQDSIHALLARGYTIDDLALSQGINQGVDEMKHEMALSLIPHLVNLGRPN